MEVVFKKYSILSGSASIDITLANVGWVVSVCIQISSDLLIPGRLSTLIHTGSSYSMLQRSGFIPR